MRYLFIVAFLLMTACVVEADDVSPGPSIPTDTYTARELVHPLWIGYCRRWLKCENPEMDVPACADELEARTCEDADCDTPTLDESVQAAWRCMADVQTSSCDQYPPRCLGDLLRGIPDRDNLAQ